MLLKCKQGYIGERCERCDVNYYGDAITGICRRCDCNGNVDFSDYGICELRTGKCLKCLFNTEGAGCQYCKPGYYGDALKQNCKPCTTCNSSIATTANNYYLKDNCPPNYFKKNVQITDKYQRIKHHFTCEPCNCSPHGSSNNGECYTLTGKCLCKKSFTGMKCEECASGYEKYGYNCISCKSNQTNNCINTLLEEIHRLANASRDYSFDTLKSLPVIKLNYFKDQLSKQSDQIEFIIDFERRVGEMIGNVTRSIPVISGQFDMGGDVANSLANRSFNTIEKTIDLKETSDKLHNCLKRYYLDLNHIISIVNATRKVNLNGNQCDLFQEQSHSMLNEIKLIVHELNEFHKNVEDQKLDSDGLLQNVKNFLNESSIIPLDSELIDRMLRLTNISFDSFEIYEKLFSRPYLQTLEIIGRTNQLNDQVQELFSNASASAQEINSKLNESFSRLELSKQNLTDLSNLYDAFPNEFNNLKTHTIEKLKNSLIRLNPQNEEKYVELCGDHVKELSNKAKQLRSKFNSTLTFASKYQNETTDNPYSRIIEIIRIMQENLNEIEEKVQDLFTQTYSEKEADEQTENRNKKSKFLADRAEELNNLHLKNIEIRLNQSKQQIEIIQNRTFIIDEINGNLKSRFTLLLDIEIGLKELNNKSSMFTGIDKMFPNTNNLLNAYNDKINRCNNTIIQDYLPRINNLKSRKALLDGNFIDEIDKIQTNIENKKKYVKSFEVRNRKMDNLHREMHRNLNEIITKIRLARQKASSIRISIRNKPIIEMRNTSNLDNLTNNLSLLLKRNTSKIQSTANSTLLPTLTTLTTTPTITNTTTATPLTISQLMQQNEIIQQPITITCKRSYESELEPSSVNSISLTFTLNELDQYDSLFVYVGSRSLFENDKNNNDFFVIELVNRRIRFIWNTGNGIQMLEHPMQIKLNNLNLSDRDKWYRVQVLRLATTTHLQVQPQSTNTNQIKELSKTFFADETADLYERLDQNETIFTNDSVIRTKSIGNNIKMDFDKNAEILVGSLPDNWIERKQSKKGENNLTIENILNDDLNEIYIPKQIKSRQMSGCLFELNLDGHSINLWNFKSTTQSCIGCREGVTEERPSNLFRFKGKYR